ncbi:O-methyltransferase [Tellurirhabdus rosea]|uniref:O-methyltransferase n=1 Tax=Tellurirhabdus rosea TaxID=2674997 RepID=UPI0022559661|nr:class I SAM-dependent methyltransferase [Tellurirhabdus rosea]
MFSDSVHTQPQAYAAVEGASRAIGFSMPSDLQTGALLKALAASKPQSRILEIGTGTGLATSWLLDGMDMDSTLISIDNEASFQAIAAEALGHDRRLELICTDAAEWLETQSDTFDLIFADAWPGKYANLDCTLNALKPGGVYVIDDMLPQPNWPAGHQANVDALVAQLEQRPDVTPVKLAWSTGIMLVVKK